MLGVLDVPVRPPPGIEPEHGLDISRIHSHPALADHAHVLGPCRVLEGWKSTHSHGAAVAGTEARDCREQAGLTRAVPAEQAVNDAAFEVHGQITDRLVVGVAAVADAHIGELDVMSPAAVNL